ncbi:(d)CMP kinase [Pantoea sp. Mhis]|uniref:(d)CMP kinase n=1 Tax=Pantoea sp. Mhis TaxID=2576759 RepID=UPI0013596496|nr:(d)CMP kinase [Pantoea sp. Mhis]MXP56129.1 (d)CMP kinase [Pantoea sp. Mhis]
MGIPVIAIDGPSSAGKGTLCRSIAQYLHWHALDSGIFYRILALAAIQDNINIESDNSLLAIANHLDIHIFLIDNEIQVIFAGKNITNEIRTQKIDNMASCIATFPRIRQAILYHQRMFRKAPGLIADGRDVGTVIFPDACVKIFLDASLEVRAYRRMLQLQEKGFDANLSQILSEIKKRDNRDINRFTAPLIPAKDALILNSTFISSNQLFKKVLSYIQKKLNIT